MNEPSTAVGNPQHHVREGEVGEELPVPHEQVEPLHVRFPEDLALREDEITEGRHRQV